MTKKLLALSVLAACSFSAHAFVAPSPPPGFGGSPGNWTVAPSPGDTVVDRVLRQSKVLPVPGSAGQKVGVAYRLGNAAGRVAAAVIYVSPHLRTAVGIAAWLLAANLVWDEASKTWKSSKPGDDAYLSDGKRYLAWPGASQYHYSLEAACSARGAFMSNSSVTYTLSGTSNGYQCNFSYRMSDGRTGNYTVGVEVFGNSTCPAGWYYTPAGCVQTPPPKQVTQQEFEEALAPKPMPPTVPGELPQPTPLPVESPSPWVNPSPGANPTSQPWRVPTGNPEPNPNYDPNAPASPTNQPYRQPYTDYIPSPTYDQPWRLDTRPGYRYLPTPQGMNDPITIDPVADPSNKPTEDEKQDLCEKHPNIVACEDGEITDQPLPPIPKLYERKYPDGLVGIWNQKSQLIKQSSTFTLAGQLMPTTLTVGACPSWVIPLNFGSWSSYGEYNVAPPCWIWDVAKTIIIISALMLARSLIFGG
ncbi:hypothetical protein [Acidovorax sp. K2F]|uniref:hypothetical protein n=1 Tax=Acidovorax sp. K2F TaxID=2978125 RepID=UPI0021B09736|nr:hypothetical protein [Acidovorax sp. K2F]MCT6717871.1 hypothetical protein [Acidovorax sp. K2F]